MLEKLLSEPFLSLHPFFICKSLSSGPFFLNSWQNVGSGGLLRKEKKNMNEFFNENMNP